MNLKDSLKDSLWVIYAMIRGIISDYTPLKDIEYDDEKEDNESQCS